MDLADIREHYGEHGLREDMLDADPIVQFGLWLEDWRATEPYDANAVIVATVDPEGWPSARAVLLKGLDERGFVFYTNRTSAKADDMAANPQVALTFLWHPVERQVRVVGLAERLPDDESDAYFASRPRESQLGAWASDQSSVIPDRAALEAGLAEVQARFPDEVPRPPHWGGYLVRPLAIEFWQGRRSRLHDRLRYRRADLDRDWTVERLAP